MARTLPLLGKILCWLGFHDFHVVGKSFVGSEGGIISTKYPDSEKACAKDADYPRPNIRCDWNRVAVA